MQYSDETKLIDTPLTKHISHALARGYQKGVYFRLWEKHLSRRPVFTIGELKKLSDAELLKYEKIGKINLEKIRAFLTEIEN